MAGAGRITPVSDRIRTSRLRTVWFYVCTWNNWDPAGDCTAGAPVVNPYSA